MRLGILTNLFITTGMEPLLDQVKSDGLLDLLHVLLVLEELAAVLEGE